jgi:hypothetical protein
MDGEAPHLGLAGADRPRQRQPVAVARRQQQAREILHHMAPADPPDTCRPVTILKGTAALPAPTIQHDL